MPDAVAADDAFRNVRYPVRRIDVAERREQEQQDCTDLDENHYGVELRRHLRPGGEQYAEQRDDRKRRQVDEAPLAGTVQQIGGQADAEQPQQASVEVPRPSDRDGRDRDRVLEDQQAGDDPGGEFTKPRVAVRVRGAAAADGRRELGVRERRTGACDAGDDEGKRDGRAGLDGGRPTGEDKDAGADDRADSEQRQVERSQYALEPGVLGKVGLDRLSSEQTHCAAPPGEPR